MNRKSFLYLPVFYLIFLCVAAQAGTFDKYLSAADVEKATGLKSVKLSYSTQKDSVGYLQFKNKEGKQILIARFNRASSFNKAKVKKMGGVKGEIKGLGEDAYYGPDINLPNVLSFKKGKVSVELSAVMNWKDVKPYLTINQLKALGRIIAARI